MAKRQGEFKRNTKDERLAHSGGFCEAEGPLYGLAVGQRCNTDINGRVEFDHFIALGIGDADNSFANCRAVCPACHRFKTSKHDVPKAAKTKRQADKNSGVRRPKGTIKSQGFPPGKAKVEKTKLPPRKLYKGEG